MGTLDLSSLSLELSQFICFLFTQSTESYPEELANTILEYIERPEYSTRYVTNNVMQKQNNNKVFYFIFPTLISIMPLASEDFLD